MGCGKSKHDVVAGNTVSQSKKSKDDQAPPPETTTTNPSVASNAGGIINGDMINAKESGKAVLAGGNIQEKVEAGQEGSGLVLLKESEREKAAVSHFAIKENEKLTHDDHEKAKETKVVTTAEDLKEKRNEDSVDEIVSKRVGGTTTKEGEEELGEEKMIHNDLQSHLINEGAIEGIITDGLSGTTVYYSQPHATTKAEEIPKPDNVVVEEKESMEESKKETTNVEIVAMTEETSIKVEVVPAEVTEGSEKVEIATKENVAETTEEGSKTN